MPYKLLAADLDGTLMGDDAIISPRVRAAIGRAIGKGVKVTLATGRGFRATKRFAEELMVNAPLICYQGGLIKDPWSGQVLFQTAVPLPLAQESEFRNCFADRLQVVRSHRLIIEGIPLGVSKGRALARLAEHLGISQEETIAIGDNDNDAEMVAWAGLGVAMAGASPAVKEVADYIAPSVEEDGAAEAIERFVLG